MRNWKSGVALTALSFAVLSAAPVAVSAAEAEVDAIEEVVVTAQRREQGAQKVGLALSVIGGSGLEEKNINIVNDVETALPNVEVDSQFGGGQPQFRIRGIGAREYSSNNASTVGIYVDEVAHPYTVTTQNALFDVSRIEVLRGPQGTLYGRNTTGGAINVVTNAPTHSFAAGASLEGGSYNRYKLEGYVSGPLNDKVRGRLAAFTEQGGGWQYNRDTAERLGDADRFGIRGRLAWDISDTVNADLSATWQRDKSDGLGFRLKTPYAVAGNPVPPYPADTEWRITGWQISPLLAAVAGVGTDAKPFRDNEGLDVSARINADLGWATLTSVTAYQQFERAEYNDWDGTRFHESDVYFYNDIDVLTQELRLASKEGGALEWLAGIYLAKESIEGGFYTDFRGYTDLIHTPYKQDVNAAGVFFHGTYALSDRFRLVGGLRYENEERELTSFGTLVGVPASASTKHKTDLSEVTGKFGLEFDLTDNALL
ncbi:MAG: TonB-dependent receptor, partial [Asticcacaulis sp.]